MFDCYASVVTHNFVKKTDGNKINKFIVPPPLKWAVIPHNPVENIEATSHWDNRFILKNRCDVISAQSNRLYLQHKHLNIIYLVGNI